MEQIAQVGIVQMFVRIRAITIRMVYLNVLVAFGDINMEIFTVLSKKICIIVIKIVKAVPSIVQIPTRMKHVRLTLVSVIHVQMV